MGSYGSLHLQVTYKDKIANILVEEKWSSDTENVCCIALFSVCATDFMSLLTNWMGQSLPLAMPLFDLTCTISYTNESSDCEKDCIYSSRLPPE